jgi:hypothetical protein
MPDTEQRQSAGEHDRLVLNTTPDDRAVAENCMRLGGHASKSDMLRAALRCYEVALAQRAQVVQTAQARVAG